MEFAIYGGWDGTELYLDVIAWHMRYDAECRDTRAKLDVSDVVGRLQEPPPMIRAVERRNDEIAAVGGAMREA